jgi:porphobilinogen synthase
MRRDDWSRRLMQENNLSANDLIYPVFLLEGKGKSEAVASMPGVNRISLDLLLNVAQECVELGIPVLALFPVIDAALKTSAVQSRLTPQGIEPSPGTRASFSKFLADEKARLEPIVKRANMMCFIVT